MTAPGEDRAVAAGDGGVRSCRKIPPGWSEKRFKYLAQTVKGHIPPSTKGDSPDTRTAPYLSMEYLRGEIEKPVFVKADQDSLYAEDGDVLLLWDGANAGEFCIAKAGIVSSTVAKIMPIGVDDRFLFWMCKGREDFVRSETVGMGIPHVNGHSLANMRVPLPPLPQQRAIADRLDRETGRLDALVAAKRRLLELLAEKRRALIAHAVTRGLDPEAPMRSTNIGWAPEIPEHWRTVKLKRISNMKSGEGITSEAIEEKGLYPVYGGNGLRGYTDSFTHEGTFALIGRQGALCGNVHLVSGRFWASEHAIVATLYEPHNVEWLVNLLTAMGLNRYSESAAQPGLAAQDIANLRVPLPPLPQQRAIADHLDRETGRLDALAGRTRESVALLRERRAALISAAVGGR